jgi:hypothetical protein
MVEFSRIGSTTPAQPGRIHVKAQDPPDGARRRLGKSWLFLLFLLFLQQIISRQDLDSRRNPGRPASRRTKEQQKPAVLPLFPEKAVKHRKARQYRLTVHRLA